MSLSSSDRRARLDRPVYGPIHNPIQWRIDKPVTTQALTSGLLALACLFALSLLPIPVISTATRVFYAFIHEISHCIMALGCDGAPTIDGVQGGHATIVVQDRTHLALVAASGPILPVAIAALMAWLGVTRQLNGVALLAIGMTAVWFGFHAISPPETTFSMVLIGSLVCLWAILPVYPMLRSTGVMLVSGILLLETHASREYLFFGVTENDSSKSDLALLTANAGFGTEQSWSAGLITVALGIIVVTAICVYNWAEQRSGL